MQAQPKYKLCRRLGSHVFEKCQTQKFAVSEGRRGKSDRRPKAASDFGLSLLEKQRVRFSYGITERQFSNYVTKATERKGTNTTEFLYEMLETRLDNVVYRLGLAHTRRLARQLVSHGHFVVNGKKVTVPSYSVKVGDVIKVRDGSRNSVLFSELEKKLQSYTIPNWLSFDAGTFEGKVTGKPKNTESVINLQTVVEFYSR